MDLYLKARYEAPENPESVSYTHLDVYKRQDLALRTDVMVLDPDAPILLPFDRIALPERLSGADGINRNTHRCLIFARNDLQAIEAYLYKFSAQPKTFRAYQKELERFLLRCV